MSGNHQETEVASLARQLRDNPRLTQKPERREAKPTPVWDFSEENPDLRETPPIRLLIVEDQAMVREAIGRLFARYHDIEVVYLAESVTDAKSFLAEHTVDVALVDFRLGDGTGDQLIKWMGERQPKTRAAILTSFEEDSVLVSSFDAGADGLFMKGSPAKEIVGWVRDLADGKRLIDTEENRSRIKAYNESAAGKYSSLDDTDKAICACVAKGMQDKDISAALFLNSQTIRNRLSKVLGVLGLANRTQLAVFVSSLGISELDEHQE